MKSNKISHFTTIISPQQQNFLRKEVSFSDGGTFFPKNFEILFLAFYFILLPYIAGLIFILLFFSNLHLNIMESIYLSHSFFLTWCIGYEILAISFLIYLSKKFIFMKL